MRTFTGKVVEIEAGSWYNALPFPYCIRWRWKVCWSIRRTVVLKNTNKTVKIEINKNLLLKDKVVIFTVWITVLAAKWKWQQLIARRFFSHFHWIFSNMKPMCEFFWNLFASFKRINNSINRRLCMTLATTKLIQATTNLWK